MNESTAHTEIVEETDLDAAELEPSDTFARLLTRTGQRTPLGSLGLDAIRRRVHERAGSSPVGVFGRSVQVR